MEDKDCIFCKIVKKEIPCNLVYENEDILAFNDLNPQAPVHLLVIPKKHFASLSEVNDEKVLLALLKGVQEVTKKLNLKEYRTIINTGESAGQTVRHIHLHILSGRDFLWPPG